MTTEAVTGPALAAAVGLLARRRFAPAVQRDSLLDGQRPVDVLDAMELLADVFLDVLAPGDAGPLFLRQLGLLAATGDRGQPVTGGQRA